MLQNDISGLPVLDSYGALVGMITEGDFLRRAETGTERKRPRWLEFFIASGRLAEEYVHTHGRKVSEVMTIDPVTVTEEIRSMTWSRSWKSAASNAFRCSGATRSSASSAAPTCCTRWRALPVKQNPPRPTTRPSASA